MWSARLKIWKRLIWVFLLFTVSVYGAIVKMLCFLSYSFINKILNPWSWFPHILIKPYSFMLLQYFLSNIIEFSRCIGTYSNEKFKTLILSPKKHFGVQSPHHLHSSLFPQQSSKHMQSCHFLLYQMLF